MDLALAFINNQKLLSVWKYDSDCYTIRKKKEIFILSEGKRFSFNQSGESNAHRAIVSCCVNCMKLQTFLKMNVWKKLDRLQCRNTVDDDFSFTQEELFIGYHPNKFDEMSDTSGSECEETILFSEKPVKKSCFTH